MKVYFTALCLCVASVPFLAVSQQPAYHWYFGNEAGLDFSSGTATAVTDGQLMTYDNSAVVSDGSGDLLFYTNGVTVWNASHAVMLNGTGLMGHLTSQHSATAFTVGSMESQHTHYIFTVDAFSGSNGLRYSTVDMALDGGNGGVALKNVPLATDVTEKVLAIRHANGVDVWLIAHGIGNNEFYAWEVNASGISSSPVTSAVGTDHPIGSPYGYGGLGQISASPDGSMIAVGMYYSSQFELLQFDRSTGSFSSPISLPGYNAAWGVEFSPDGSKLYGTGWGESYLYQFDLSSYTFLDISSSAAYVGTVTGPHSTYKAGSLSLGPDGRIYVAKYESGYLGVIQNPNGSGSGCSYNDSGLYLNGKQSLAGLSIFLKDALLTGSTQAAETGVGFTIHPNPCLGSFTVQLANAPLIGANHLILLDGMGRTVKKCMLTDAFVHVSVDGLATGVYQAVWQQDGVRMASAKIVVQ